MLTRHLRAAWLASVVLIAVANAVAQAPLPRTTEPADLTTDLHNASPPPSPAPPTQAPAAPTVPPTLHGFNAGATVAGIHDSVVGWSTLFTPTIGYSFNDILSVDATLPVYMYRLAESLSARPRRNQQLVNQRGELGDLVMAMHAQFIPPLFQYQVTAALSAPTGDEDYGLTTGRATFDVNNHFERTFRRLTPNLELGIGDSSTLVNRIVSKNYTTLGPLAHFQAGLGLTLPHDLFFESDAYEQLPIGDQKIYGPSRRGKATIVTGHNVSEDNGFTSSLDLPIDRHTTFTGYYSRSLRLRIDSVGIGLTYVLRAPPQNPETPLDDLFR